MPEFHIDLVIPAILFAAILLMRTRSSKRYKLKINSHEFD